MNNIKFRVVVVHPDQQHSFRTASTLKEANCLDKYITTVYDRKKSTTSFIKKFLRGTSLKKIEAHKCDCLSDKEILQFCELFSIFLLFLARIDKKKILFNYLNELRLKRFNNNVLRYLLNNSVDAVVVYDSLSGNLIELIDKKLPNLKIITDMSAPFYPFMSDIFFSDIEKNKAISTNIHRELTSSAHRNKIERSSKEIKFSDAFLVASEFSKKSLVAYGVNENQIYICRYGIDIENINLNRNRVENKNLKCVYIGNFNQKKGVHYLLNAIKMIEDLDIDYYFIGSYLQEIQWYKKLKNKYIFTGHVSKDIVFELLKSADVLVFPSLADGFGFSVLEAQASGVPVICSLNAGISDLIIDGYNGFKVEAGSSKQISDRLSWFCKNRDKIEKMRENARNTALIYSWESYNECLIKSVNEIIISEKQSSIKCMRYTKKGE